MQKTPQSVEDDIVRQLGAVYEPYTGSCFASTRETDIGAQAAPASPWLRARLTTWGHVQRNQA